MKKLVLIFALVLILAGCSSTNRVGPDIGEDWVALHLLHFTDDGKLDTLGQAVPKLKEMGLNVLVLEVDYSFEYKSHPELIYGEKYITKAGAQKFAEICKENDIKLVIQFQSFGHQSWAEETFSLLTVYPELDLTPGAFPNNEGIYCREWDPMNPKVYEIVYALLDELVDAFEPEAIHVGMDEVFLITNEHAKSTKDLNPAEVYAKAVNDMHKFIVGEKGLEMMMWGDRFINYEEIKYGAWEADSTGTHPAIDMVPKDIIICDWHYELMDEFPSVPMFIEKGFRVIPCSWRRPVSTESLINYSYKYDSPQMLGHLFTTWGGNLEYIMNFESMKVGLELLKEKQVKKAKLK